MCCEETIEAIVRRRLQKPKEKGKTKYYNSKLVGKRSFA